MVKYYAAVPDYKTKLIVEKVRRKQDVLYKFKNTTIFKNSPRSPPHDAPPPKIIHGEKLNIAKMEDNQEFKKQKKKFKLVKFQK